MSLYSQYCSKSLKYKAKYIMYNKTHRISILFPVFESGILFKIYIIIRRYRNVVNLIMCVITVLYFAKPVVASYIFICIHCVCVVFKCNEKKGVYNMYTNRQYLSLRCVYVSRIMITVFTKSYINIPIKLKSSSKRSCRQGKVD